MLSFALGNDVSTNTIFGLPTILAFTFNVNMKTFTVYSPCINAPFNLTRSAGRLGLPDGITFDLDVFHCMHEAALVTAPSSTSTIDVLPDDSLGRLHGLDDISQGYVKRTITAQSD